MRGWRTQDGALLVEGREERVLSVTGAPLRTAAGEPLATTHVYHLLDETGAPSRRFGVTRSAEGWEHYVSFHRVADGRLYACTTIQVWRQEAQPALEGVVLEGLRELDVTAVVDVAALEAALARVEIR